MSDLGGYPFISMTFNLPSVPEKVKVVLRLVKSLGPLLLSKSTSLSEAYAQHNLRLAKVEVFKELVIEEGRMTLGIVKKLREKYVDASPEERIRLRQDIEAAERDYRQLRIYEKAIDHVPEVPEGRTPMAESLEDFTDSSTAWLDRFNDLARKQNEPWRAELLARALALESSKVGSVSQRGLWFIGTMDETIFHAFAAILDASPKFNYRHVLPDLDKYADRTVSTCALESELTLGQLTFILHEVGLLGNLLTSSLGFRKGDVIQVAYGSRCVTGAAKIAIQVKGIILTSLGHTVAKLYEPKVVDLGFEILNDWADTMRSGALEVLEEV